MAVNIVTGMTGVAHITSDDDRAKNAAIFGTGKYVIDYGKKFETSILSNNQIRVHDGMCINQGTQMGIELNDYEDVIVENGVSGSNRNDLIVMRYERNEDTGIEKASLVVIKGTSGSTATDPSYNSGNILDGGELIDDMPLFRVKIESLSITEVEPLFVIFDSLDQISETVSEMIESGVYEKIESEPATDFSEAETPEFQQTIDGVLSEVSELKSDLDNIGLTGNHIIYRKKDETETYVKRVDISLKKGKYIISYNNLVSSDTSADTCLIAFMDGSSNVIKSIYVPRNTSHSVVVEFDKDIYVMYLYASTNSNASIGETFEYTKFTVLNTYISGRFDKLENYTNNIKKISSKRFYSEINFQSNTISTTDGTNATNPNHIRTEALLKADEDFFISLTDKIKGIIYYYSSFSLNSYKSFSNIESNDLTMISKGTYYRLVLYYADGRVPNIGNIVDNVSILYDLVDRIEKTDMNTDDDWWGNYGIDITNGTINTDRTYIHTSNIQKSSYSIIATGGYGFSVYVYDKDVYIGCLNADTVSKEVARIYKRIDLSNLASMHPTYTFRIVGSRVDSNLNHINDVMTYEEGKHIKMFTKFEQKLYDEKTFCPLVSFIDDDVPKEALDNWMDIGIATGIRCGFAVPTGIVSDEIWRAIEKMNSAGFEFLSHTHNHINLMNEQNPTVIEDDLQASVEAFHKHGIRVRGLVYPQSSINNLASSIIEKYFEFSFNGSKGIESIQGNPLRHHNFTRTDTVEDHTISYTDPNDGVTYNVHDVLPLNTLKSYVDYAVENNCWIVFETHFRNSRTAFEGNDGFYYTDEIKQKTIDLIRYAIEKGCKVVTPSEGFDIMKNRLIRGVYGSNNYYIIDRNGEIYRKNM